MIRTEPIDKWVRGRLDDRVVVETREPLLVWQGRFPPVYAFRRDEVVEGVLRPAAGSSYDGFFFHGPQAPVEEWFDVVSGDRVLPCTAWSLDDDAVRDRVVISWEHGRLDWTEEDEAVGTHPRDPHKRVEALASSRLVEVVVDGVTLASSDRPVLLLETDLLTRYYVPAEDVRPYKGQADGYWTYPGPPPLRNLAWSYSTPAPGIASIAGRIAFYNEMVDLTVDGLRLERPESPFSRAAQRPGGAD